jgi:cytochrome b subunit of formate dehydrogenase
MGENIMAQQLYIFLILLLFVGGFTGWALFAITFGHIYSMKHTQIKMIEDIQTDITHIKSEIKELK